jgi:ABC-type proline/glycine betaine transport system permease subunit
VSEPTNSRGLADTNLGGATGFMGFVEFVRDRWAVLSFLAYQHMSLVVQTLLLATACALVVGILIYRSPWGIAVGDTLTSVGLTIPSYALLGVLVGFVGLGIYPSVIMLVFFGFFPILRNVVVGLTGVDKALVEPSPRSLSAPDWAATSSRASPVPAEPTQPTRSSPALSAS